MIIKIFEMTRARQTAKSRAPEKNFFLYREMNFSLREYLNRNDFQEFDIDNSMFRVAIALFYDIQTAVEILFRFFPPVSYHDCKLSFFFFKLI